MPNRRRNTMSVVTSVFAFALEGGVRQADGTQEICALGQVAAQGRVEFVQGALGSDEGHEAAGTHFFHALGKEVVVDQKTTFGQLRIDWPVVTEGHVGNREIEGAIHQGGLLEALGAHVGVRVELGRDAGGHRVQFDADELRTVRAVPVA